MKNSRQGYCSELLTKRFIVFIFSLLVRRESQTFEKGHQPLNLCRELAVICGLGGSNANEGEILDLSYQLLRLRRSLWRRLQEARLCTPNTHCLSIWSSAPKTAHSNSIILLGFLSCLPPTASSPPRGCGTFRLWLQCAHLPCIEFGLQSLLFSIEYIFGKMRECI